MNRPEILARRRLQSIQGAMTVDFMKDPPKRSGPHAQRTAQMRQRLCEAATACLHRVGYAATTVQLVTEEANVSRGAMLHHYPTKVDLMVAVAEYAAEKQNRYVRWRLSRVPEGMDRYMAITQATWEATTQPWAIALLELMMASRSDPSLGERFPAVLEALESRQREDVWSMAQDLGIRDKERVLTMVRLHVAAMRGLSLEMMFSGERKPAERAMRLLEDYKAYLTGQLVTDRPQLPPIPPRG
jgi:AcrR family transcriptional regulator